MELVLRLVPQLDKRHVGGLPVPVLLAFVLALLLAYGAGLDFFAIFGVQFAWPVVGPLLSAIFMVGGSNLIHDLVGWVQAAKEGARLLR